MNWDAVAVSIVMAAYLGMAVWIWTMDHSLIIPPGRRFALRVYGAVIAAWLIVFWIPRLLWSTGWWDFFGPFPIRYASNIMHLVQIAAFGVITWTIRESTRLDSERAKDYEVMKKIVELENGARDGGSG